MTTLDERVGSLEDRIAAVDPGLGDAIVVNNPTPAVPSDGPNRLTFWVPQHLTTLSLGQASDTWGTSLGIVGITEPNVYFETTDAPKTALSLGTSGKGSGFIGVGITGYKLKTHGNIFRHATGQLYFTTSGGDMIVNANAATTALQSDGANVEINAGDNISIKATSDAAITAERLSPCQVTYAGAFTHQTVPETSDGEKIHAIAELLQSCIDFALALKGPLFQGEKMSTGDKPSELDKAALVISGVKILGSLVGVLQNAGALGGLNSAKINAKNDVALGAGLTGIVGAPLSAAVTGGFAASLVGSCAAVVGMGYAAVWGGAAADMSGKKVYLSCMKGDTCVQSKSGTSVIGKSVRMTSGTTAQLNSKSGAAAYGKDTFYLGAASTYGVWADDGKVVIGKMSNMTDFAKAKPQDEGVIEVMGEKITSDQLHVKFTKDSSFKMTRGSNVALEFKDSKVHVKLGGIDMFGEGKVELVPK